MILTDISKNTSPDVRAEDIISKHVGYAMSKHVTESTQRLISKLLGSGRKLVRGETTKKTPGRGGKKPRKITKKGARAIKRHIS